MLSKKTIFVNKIKKIVKILSYLKFEWLALKIILVSVSQRFTKELLDKIKYKIITLLKLFVSFCYFQVWS